MEQNRKLVFCHKNLSRKCTGKSFSEVLIFASTNPHYDKVLFIELPVQYIKIPSSEYCQNMFCTQNVWNVKTKKQTKNNLCTKHVLRVL